MNLFEHYYFRNQILIGKLPAALFAEITHFVAECRKFKDHELGFLRNHINAGKNSYQVSIPRPMIENSFSFPYIIKLGEYYYSRTTGAPMNPHDRKVRLRCNENHFDGYDFWINFTRSGDENPLHNHGGNLSSVIYVANADKVPTLFEDGFSYVGAPGDIVLFPAPLRHKVDKHQLTAERITLSFNLVLKGDGAR